MLNTWLPIAFILALGISAWVLRADAEQAEARALAAEQEVTRLRNVNLDLADSVARQNAEILALQVPAAAAEVRVERVLVPLPALIKKDRTAGTRPQEMNQWLDDLFPH